MVDNIKRLMKLRWAMFFRTAFICVAVGMGAEFLISAGILLYSVLHQSTQGLYISHQHVTLVGGVMIVVWCAFLQHRDDRLSMFSGNAWSRFVSGMLESHMILAALVLLSGVGYILDALYYRLLAAAGLSLDVSLSFQPAYMAYGMLQLFVLALALYGLLSLFCCILGRFGLKKTLCGMAFLIGVVIFVSVLRFGTLRWSYGFYLIVNSISRLLTESGQVEFILEMLAIWAVSLICTALLTKTYRKWRLGNTWDCLYLVVVLYLVYVVAIISGFTQYSATVCGVETDTSELIANAVTAEKEVTYEQATMYDYDIWDIPIADTSGMFLSETEAREYGLNVDAWGLTAGTARIVWCFTPSDWFGTARMEVFAKELEASVHYDSSLNYMVMGAMKTTVLQQSCYPLANRFYLGSGENASSIGSLCTITVLEDSDYERWSNDNEAVLEDSDGEE